MPGPHLILWIFVMSMSSMAQACLNAYQFKIFPVGVVDSKIISIDFQIRRTSAREGMFHYGIEVPPSENEMEELHVLSTFISAYDPEGLNFSTIPIDTSYVFSTDHSDKLNAIYQRLVEQVLHMYPKLDLFTPEYLSYCAYMDSCELLALAKEHSDSVLTVAMEGKLFRIPQLADSTYHGNNDEAGRMGVEHSGIGSIRTYRSATVELVVVHLATGNDYSIARFDEDNSLHFDLDARSETKPDQPFDNIRTHTYLEPLLHHGYGIDVYLVK